MKSFVLAALAVSTCAAQMPLEKEPVKMFIESRAEHISLELTRDIAKSCPSVVSITDNQDAAELRLAITPGATTLFKSDGKVEHVFAAPPSGLEKEVCAYMLQR